MARSEILKKPGSDGALRAAGARWRAAVDSPDGSGFSYVPRAAQGGGLSASLLFAGSQFLRLATGSLKQMILSCSMASASVCKCTCS